MSMQLPFISVILPVRNEEKYIRACVDSVFAQDYPADKMEVIFVDGCSSDRTVEILREMQKDYPQIPHYEVDTDRVKIPAAWMIDQCGWKGKRLGNAGVHDKQALVLVNCGGATGAEVVRLSEEIQQSVFKMFGIQIYPEVNFIGV